MASPFFVSVSLNENYLHLKDFNCKLVNFTASTAELKVIIQAQFFTMNVDRHCFLFICPKIYEKYK